MHIFDSFLLDGRDVVYVFSMHDVYHYLIFTHVLFYYFFLVLGMWLVVVHVQILRCRDVLLLDLWLCFLFGFEGLYILTELLHV